MKLENVNQNSFWYLLNIFQLTILKFYLNILDSKEATKDQIQKSFTLFNYFCFWLSILPFLWFICKLPNSTNRATLSLNLPGLNTPSNEIFWETLLNSFDYNEKLFESVKEIEINNNSFLVNHEKLNKSIQSLLVINDPESKSYLKEFKPRSSELNNPSLKQIDLDEIPTRLESNFLKTNKKDLELLAEKNQVLIGKFGDTKVNKVLPYGKKNVLNKKNESEQQHLKIAVSKEKTKLKLVKTQKFFSSSFSKNNEKETQLFDKRLKNWINFSTASEVFAKYSRIHSLNFTNKSIINELNYSHPRFMTGYIYPDLNTFQVWNLVSSRNYETDKNLLSISYYPKSIYFSGSFFSSIEKQNASFINPLYEIGQNKEENGFVLFLRHDFKTQDLAVKNRFETQTSFLKNGIINNVETIKPIYFFANLNKTDLEKLVKENFGSVGNLEKTPGNNQQSLVQQTSFFSLSDTALNNEEISSSYNHFLTEKNTNLIGISDFRNQKIYFIPTTEGTQNIKSFLSDEKHPLFSNIPLNTFDRLPVIQISDPLVKVSNSIMEYSPNLYKREIGSYWKTKVNQTEEFLTLNQILTSNSIFSVSLVGFLISTFLILKTAYGDYAKEFSSYLLDLISSGKGLTLDPSTIEWLNQELGLEEKKGGIRIFPKRFSKKRFTDIAGIKKLLPELSELVWFLRNRGRKFNITPLTSKSILLVGPPGTGKTLLVQALAAEAEVPVVAQSTSVLAGMNQDLTPGDAIRMAFQKARTLAPCILFLDELDSLGLKRDSLLTNNAQQSLGIINEDIKSIPFFEKTFSKGIELTEASELDSGETKEDYLTNQLRINITNEFNARKQQEREQVAALTQLLIEIDGVQTNSGILVIGATNRSSILDPALTRPGRFSKVISLPLPDKNKRIEIFKLHSLPLGWDMTINWDYLAQRTKGFSAGDLATVANQSAIQAILDNSKHKLETFEKAITILTTYPIEKGKGHLGTEDPYYFQREVYYKVAQTFYNYSFNVENKPAFVELNARQANPRHYQILNNINNDKNRLRTRSELENLLTSLISGKVGELLMLFTLNQKNNSYWESDLSKNDLYEATKLIILMMQDWYLYDNNFHQQKFLNIPSNQNYLEYRKNEEIFSLFEETVSYLEQQLTTTYTFSFTQSPVQKAEWKSSVIEEISNIDSLFAEWSRFHLPDPQETERNPEWIPPEEYYHDNEVKKYFSPNELEKLQTFPPNIHTKSMEFENISFSELALIERDRYLQTILLNSFNKAFLVLETNREILDNLAYFLFKNKILRSFELEELIKKF